MTALEPVDIVEPVEVREPEVAELEVTPPHIQQMVATVDDPVPQECKDQLEQQLNKYSSAISSGPTDVGETDVVCLTIDTGDHPPMRQARRQIPIAKKEALDKVLDD